jgi:hypothetical protein
LDWPEDGEAWLENVSLDFPALGSFNPILMGGGTPGNNVRFNPTIREEERLRCFCLYPEEGGTMCEQILELVEKENVEIFEDVEMVDNDAIEKPVYDENKAMQVDVDENVESEIVDTEDFAVEMTEVENSAVEERKFNPKTREEGRIRCFCLYPGEGETMCEQIVELVESRAVEMPEDVEMLENENEEAMQGKY